MGDFGAVARRALNALQQKSWKDHTEVTRRCACSAPALAHTHARDAEEEDDQAIGKAHQSVREQGCGSG